MERQRKFVLWVITELITRHNHLYVLKKKTPKNIYDFNHVHWRTTDNVTFSSEVIEFMIDHSNQNS